MGDNDSWGYHPTVHAGDTISWYIRLLGNSTSDKLWYKMGWSIPSGGERFIIGAINRALIPNEVGVYYEGADYSNPGDWDLLPSSEYRVWDLKLLDQNGQNVPL